MRKQSISIDPLSERAELIERLSKQGIPVRLTRLHGTQMRPGLREGWEPFSFERAKELLREMEGPSKLDIANARMRQP